MRNVTVSDGCLDFPFPESKQGHCPIISRALHKRFLHKSDAKVTIKSQ